MTDRYTKRGNTYGGLLNEYDFDTANPTRFSSPTNGSDIARRIVSGWRFDKERQRETEYRDEHAMNQRLFHLEYKALRKDDII